jgi:hypothetical protein
VSDWLGQDRAAPLLLRLARVVEDLTQISCALARADEFGIQKVVEIARKHLLAFSGHDVLAA